MKTYIFVILMFIICGNIFSQDMMFDSLTTAREYKFVLYNEKEVTGRIERQDSVYIIVRGDEGIYRLRKDDIFLVTRNLTPSVYNTLISLGAGVSMMGRMHSDGYYGGEHDNGFTLSLSSLFPLNENRGVRLNLEYTRTKTNNDEIPVYEYGYYRSDQNRDIVSLAGEYVFGYFTPIKKINAYGLAGLGINYINDGEYTYSYPLYDTNNTIRRETYDPEPYFGVLMTVGAGLNVPLSYKFKAFAELKINMIASESFFFFWGSAYFPFRVGLTYAM